MPTNGPQPCTTKPKSATRLTDDASHVATSKRMYGTCYYVQVSIHKLPAPKPSMNSAPTYHDTTHQPPCHSLSLTASNNGSLATNPPQYSYLPMMKTQMPTSTNSSTKHTATKGPLDGATSFEAKSLQHGNKQLLATTMRDNQEVAITQHCGQGKPLTKCGPCFEPSGYAAMDNYMEKRLQRTTIYSSPNNTRHDRAGKAECEFEHAKATKKGKVLFRKPYNEAFKYEKHPVDMIDKKENKGFTVVVDCAPLFQDPPPTICAPVVCKVPSITMSEVVRVLLTSQAYGVHPVRVSMHVDGDYAYLGDYVPRQLYIYDVSDKTAPTFVSSITLIQASGYIHSNFHGIWYDDGNVYTAHRGTGITIMVNVTDPSTPVQTDTRNDGYTFKGLITWKDTSDDHLFSGRGFAMYRLDNVNGKLGLPISVNPYINGDGREVVVNPDGNYAYRSTANAGINVPMGVYNIADKSVNPTEIGSFYENTGEEQPREMEISPDGPYLYAATVYDGF